MLHEWKNYRFEDIKEVTRKMNIYPVDIMVTGVTGAGKSTTLNALFEREVAKVGRGVDPETMSVISYKLNEVARLWDTPGLGDGVEKDRLHERAMVDTLLKTYTYESKLYGFIDMVIVIIEGINRDMGTTYKLLKDVILPHITPDRVLVAINQADVAMKGRNWDYTSNSPNQELLDYLDNQAISIKKRVREGTGLDIKLPVYYSAEQSWNIGAFYDFIIDNMPVERRKI
ncbi:GTPase [Veillonella caviae]|nr:GTPase [Veillonella caviae]MDY4746815.1 GTPase [Veillonella caviae]MDY6225225.1 GTPase [Veillonella caviae]